MHPHTLTSPRVAPAMIGLGLLEAVPEEALLSLADPDDANADGISGRPNRVWDKVLGQDGSGSLRLEGQSTQRGAAGGRARFSATSALPHPFFLKKIVLL